ncbi:hypothetical protein SAMN03159488_05386 [Pseudomonas sp. NFIX10]|uniref:hypothetical protein n=1 Tax=unclassified Pseudomonas TaxID=196821 RepID=UPI0008E89613|nr:MULTISPECIES: hypothetical protein [unclassified Pseudomonas]SFB57226.1 hypothetical protein SAMN03159488_05386 [Pseudomonas sp. NFIX10]SFF51154.1 hypothetical protein SAMN03159367_04990 [Pseudomonas sp. NFACC06-1]
MTKSSDMVVLRSLLFVFDIENTIDEAREEIIVSKDINADSELVELFDSLLKADFLTFQSHEREWFIEKISFYLEEGANFDEIFSRIITYFDDDVKDPPHFMRVLLSCLKRYQSEVAENS